MGPRQSHLGAPREAPTVAHTMMIYTARRAVDLAVLIPLKNEADNIPVLAEEIQVALEGLTHHWECVWVDDGSTDGSAVALARLRERDARHRVFTLDRNYGQSAALLAGIREIRAPLIATMDADLQNDPGDLPRLIEHLERRGAGMVNGVRARRQDAWLRRLSSRIGNGFRNFLTGEKVSDVGCSLRVFRSECVSALPSFRGMHRFLPTLARVRGYEVVEIPVRHRPRLHGRTKYGMHNRLWVGIVDTLGVRWLKARWVEPHLTRPQNPDTIGSPSTEDLERDSRDARLDGEAGFVWNTALGSARRRIPS
ncbi:MAG: glycosyltransferase family 2 protein [Gemmatimonadota bacterium]